MVGKPVFTSIILVILVASVNSDGCLCTDKFKELFGITDAVAQIQRAYFKNDDIRVPLYGFYFSLIRELGTDFVISIAKYDSLDKHPIWDPFVKNLTDRMEVRPKKKIVLNTGQLERLQPLAKLYSCIFNKKLMCLLGIADHVSNIEESIHLNSHVHDILYDFLMLLSDRLALESVLQGIDDTNIYGVCDTFTEKVEAQLKSLDKFEEKEVKAVFLCASVTEAYLLRSCTGTISCIVRVSVEPRVCKALETNRLPKVVPGKFHGAINEFNRPIR